MRRLRLSEAIIGTLLVVVLAMGFAAACATSEVDDTSGSGGYTDLGRGLSVKSVTVDGIRCVVLDGYEAGAISCDWSTP